MTPKQFTSTLETIGISQRGAARLLGVDERTSRKWVAGAARIPQSVALLLRLMIRLNLTPDDVR